MGAWWRGATGCSASWQLHIRWGRSAQGGVGRVWPCTLLFFGLREWPISTGHRPSRTRSLTHSLTRRVGGHMHGTDLLVDDVPTILPTLPSHERNP